MCATQSLGRLRLRLRGARSLGHPVRRRGPAELCRQLEPGPANTTLQLVQPAGRPNDGSGIAGCTGSGTVSGPDGSSQVSGACSDVAGNAASASAQISYDATPPTVVETRTDRRALLRRVVQPSSGSDRAGHNSAPKAFKLRYDATPPSLTDVVAQVGNKFALLKWKISADVASVRVTRKPGRAGEEQTVVYSGKADFYKDTGIDNRMKYEYRVIAADEAADATPEATATAVPLPALFSPAAGARVRAPILLEWLPIAKTTYYNLQVWCGGRKILSAWPKRPRLVLPARGKLAGRAYVLPLGSCRWYVWPGHGRFVEKRYGRLAGTSTFVRRR